MPGALAGLFVVCLPGRWGGERFTHSALPGTSLSRRRKNSRCSETDAASLGMWPGQICEWNRPQANETVGQFACLVIRTETLKSAL